MTATPHDVFQHSGQVWLTRALRNNTGLLAKSIGSASMVWVDLYCYSQRAHASVLAEMERGADGASEKRDEAAAEALVSAIRVVAALPQFQKTGGSNFVFYLVRPGWAIRGGCCVSSRRQAGVRAGRLGGRQLSAQLPLMELATLVRRLNGA